MTNALPVILCLAAMPLSIAGAESLKITVTIDRGRDLGQGFGSLFEGVSEDGSLVFGAGFQNAYNTRYRADRHAVQFFIRPASGRRELATEELPRPNNLCGAYLFGRDGTVYSTYGGLKAWNQTSRTWQESAGTGGTHETARVGNGTLTFGDSTVRFDGQTIIGPPEKGSYQLFFYANGHLCFYHVNRGDEPYRLYKNDEDGFSRLYACPWTPQQREVDLSKAVTLRLPVVGRDHLRMGPVGRQDRHRLQYRRLLRVRKGGLAYASQTQYQPQLSTLLDTSLPRPIVDGELSDGPALRIRRGEDHRSEGLATGTGGRVGRGPRSADHRDLWRRSGGRRLALGRSVALQPR